MITIQINGEERKIEQGLKVDQLLEQLKLDAQRVVVERNRDIVPREKYSVTALSEGDQLEILHFVGGG
jgi:thiamine biosynthesis protein ThiS